ncbi:phospholipase D family protein [Diaphorobacter nitroreducens]|uniref:phospholipase D family protein n=1 Tax=Diaphorobacter nitroreducens TaxID=164759 RepID=UPI0028A1E05D|nr:phospholipase D family protein [Diaphorobacter nitroreducens]
MYLEQPRKDSLLSHIVRELARNDYQKYSSLKVLVAYAKMSGVDRVAAHFARIIENGGTVELVIGIGQTNTSKEAIETLINLGCKVSIFHNPSSLLRTFHPKVYLFRSEDCVWASVGSSNLTAGGLQLNYEINQISSLHLESTEQAETAAKLEDIINSYNPKINKSARSADAALINELHKRGLLPSEATLWEKTLTAARDYNRNSAADLFNAEKIPEPPSQKVNIKFSTTKKVGAATGILLTNSKGFWKRLSPWDVSHSSSPGQIQIPKNFRNQFPHLSAPVITKSGAEQADSYFDVVFEDATGNTSKISNARYIIYTPAPDHRRPNSESRFTFRQFPGVFDTFKEGDVLEFRRSSSPGIWFNIRLVPASAAQKLHPSGKFGFI